jgi:hypothetical protein
MDSSEENLGLALLRKWKITGKEISLIFTTGIGEECEFRATGKVKNVSAELLHLEGKTFEWACDLRIVGFGPVCSEELLARVSPSLIGKQPETIELRFSKNGTCKLQTGSNLAN